MTVPVCLLRKKNAERNRWGRSNANSVGVVMFGTCVGFGYEGFHDADPYAGILIIDEAGMVMEPHCLIPLQYLTSDGALVLVGDDKQLRPMVQNECAKGLGLLRLSLIHI